MKHVVRFLALTAVWGFACSHGTLGLSVSLPSALASSAQWYEIAAYKGTSCQALSPMLQGGVPEGYAARLAWQQGDPIPNFGDVSNDSFAFGAVARDKTCAIIATGCSQVDAGKGDDISIALAAVTTPVGACPAGASCQAARCVPANDNSDPSVGAGCSLELLGSGPLANSSGEEGTVVSAPGIVALSEGGFLISYREVDTSGARLVLLSVDDSGGAQKPLRPALPTCSTVQYASDGVGMLLDGDTGFITLAGCSQDTGSAPALDLLDFSAANPETPGVPVPGQFFVSASPTSSQVQVNLGAARPATLRAGGNLMVFTENGIAHIATLDPANGVGAPSGTFGETGVTGAWTSASSSLLALMSVGPGDPNAGTDPNPNPGDDDDDGGSGFTPVDSGAPSTDSTLRLLMLPSSTDITTIATGQKEITFAGSFGSIATLEGRAIVVSDSGQAATQSVTYRTFDLGANGAAPTEASDTGGFGVNSVGSTAANVSAADVAILGNRAYFAALETGQVALNVFDNATTTLTPLRTVSFSDLTRISGISTVRDGSVSIAVSNTRIGVVWTTAKTLTSNDADGGYAVFACTQ